MQKPEAKNKPRLQEVDAAQIKSSTPRASLIKRSEEPMFVGRVRLPFLFEVLITSRHKKPKTIPSMNDNQTMAPPNKVNTA